MRTGRKIFSSFIFILLISINSFAQEKQKITVEWIYSDEGQSITQLPNYYWLTNGKAIEYDSRVAKENRVLNIFDPESLTRKPVVDLKTAITNLKDATGDKSYEYLPVPSSISKLGDKAVFVLNGDIYILTFAAADFERVTNTSEVEKNVNFSPDGNLLAYVRNNNLFCYDIRSKKETALTADGSENILNGTLSWVYWEEVFGRNDIAYWWSNDSKSIAYLQTDESNVSTIYYSDIKPWVPRVIKQKYPKIGDPNPIVKVGVIDVVNPKTTWIDLSKNPYEYIIRVNWLPNSKELAIQTMNRYQDELNILIANAGDGEAKQILKEKDPGWVNIHDDLYFLKEGREFIWMSERTGFAHLYRYSIDGNLINQITKGEWAVASSSGSAYWVHRSVSAVDEKNGLVYFTAQEKDHKEKHLYSVKFDGSDFRRITNLDGTHKIYFSPDTKYFFDTYSNIKNPPVLNLHKCSGELIKTIAESNKDLFAKINLERPTQFTVNARDGFPLPVEIVKPANFDANKKYPLIIYLYGGPSAPQVLNNWRNSIYFDNVLIENGFLTAIVDPRSACAISKKLENLLTKNLSGNVELNDLVDAVRWFKNQNYIDSSRIGVWGWSGGGSFTLNAMTNSKEFKAGIAVAAVSDQRFYDTKFGESSMKTEKENKDGFERNSFLGTAKNLHGRLMIVHGTYDDNVHIQNAWAFIDELIKNNIMFDLMVYPMRMHGIADRSARIHLYNTMLEFWKKNL